MYLAKSNINNKREQGRLPERGSTASSVHTMRVIIYTLLSDSNYSCHLTLVRGERMRGRQWVPDKD